MIIVIKRRGVETGRVAIERLVSTLGFGEDCDVSLARDRADQKLGMLIQQGEGLSFRPLKHESLFYLGDVLVDGMMPLGEGEWLRVDEFELSWSSEGQPSGEAPLAVEEPLPPPPTPSPVLPNRAGAMMAYGQTPPPTAAAANQSEESLELSMSAQSATPPAPPPVLSGVEEVKVEEPPAQSKVESVSVSPPPPVPEVTGIEETRSQAEAQLMEKLKRLETVKKPVGKEVEPTKSEARSQDWKESEEELLGPAWKRVVKYFYHHIDLSIFNKLPEDRKEYFEKALEDSLNATLPAKEHAVVKARVEKELHSAAPFDRLILSNDIQSMRVTDKSLLAIDRGKGYGNPEMSFYNPGHVCWSFDQFLQSKGKEVRLRGSDCQALDVSGWMVHAYFPPVIQDGFLIQLKREPKSLSLTLEWAEEASVAFESLLRAKKNLLVVAREPSELMQLFYLMQGHIRDTQVLGVLGERIKQLEGEQKFIFLDESQSMSQVFKVSQHLGLSGVVDFDVEGKGKTVFQQSAFKDLSYWGYVHASKPTDALRRFELHWRLTNTQSDRTTIREWVQASFPFMVHLDRSEAGVLRGVVSAVGFKDGRWTLKRLPDGEWN